MTPLRLDYKRTASNSIALDIVVLAASLVCAAWLLGKYAELRELVDTSEYRLATLNRAAERRAVLLRNKTQQSSEPSAAAARLAPEEWLRLLNCTETAVDETVTLLALMPNEREHEVVLSGEAKSFPAVAAFISRLEAGDTLRDVRLLSHDIVREHPQKPVRFGLVAEWRVRP